MSATSHGRKHGSDVAERDFVAAWWLLAESTGHDLHDEPGARWFHTGLDDQHLNAVLETRLDADDADPTLDRIVEELRRRGAPFLWWVLPGSTPADLAARLAARGLVAEDPWPAMALPVASLIPPPTVPGLEVHRVTDDAALELYSSIYSPILSPSTAFTELLLASSRTVGFEASAPEVHFVGHLDGEPVATTSLLTAGGAAGIYNVTTVESARRRGIGAAMTAAAVAEGRRRGLTVATLQASTMGRSVYERLGFRHVGDFVPFRPAATHDAG